MTDNTEALPPLERAIDDCLDGYVLEGDDGYHLPTEHEKLIVKDAIMGLLEEPEFCAALAQRQQVPEGWSELVAAAQAVVERWDTPVWKQAQHTGEYINRLRAALTAAPSAQRQQVPHPGSPEASAMMDSVLAEYGWPANAKNAARAGFEAARRLLAAAPAITAASSAQQGAQVTTHDKSAWASYVAGMIGAYLGWKLDDERSSAVASIIERRLWALTAAPSAQAARQAVNHATNTDSPIHFPSAQAEPVAKAKCGNCDGKGYVDSWTQDGEYNPTHCEDCAAPPTAQAEPQEPLPPILFDGYAVYQALDKKAQSRTSAENVSDVLDAVVRSLRGIRKQEGK